MSEELPKMPYWTDAQLRDMARNNPEEFLKQRNEIEADYLTRHYPKTEQDFINYENFANILNNYTLKYGEHVLNAHHLNIAAKLQSAATVSLLKEEQDKSLEIGANEKPKYIPASFGRMGGGTGSSKGLRGMRPSKKEVEVEEEEEEEAPLNFEGKPACRDCYAEKMTEQEHKQIGMNALPDIMKKMLTISANMKPLTEKNTKDKVNSISSSDEDDDSDDSD